MTTSYPFVTKAQIAERIDRDATFVSTCMLVMHQRHEARVSGSLLHGGWMASQAKQASQLTLKFASGEATPGDTNRARKLLHGYIKQLTSHFRVEQIRANPGLAEAARLFGVGGENAPTAPAPLAPDPGATGEDGEPEPPLASFGETSAPEQDEEEQATALAVVAALRAEPAMRSEEIAARLETTTATLAPLLHTLVSSGRLEKVGNGRGTRYRPID